MKVFGRYGIGRFIVLALLFVLLVLAFVYGERINPWDGIPFNAPKCTQEQAANPRLKQCHSN